MLTAHLHQKSTGKKLTRTEKLGYHDNETTLNKNNNRFYINAIELWERNLSHLLSEWSFVILCTCRRILTVHFLRKGLGLLLGLVSSQWRRKRCNYKAIAWLWDMKKLAVSPDTVGTFRFSWLRLFFE